MTDRPAKDEREKKKPTEIPEMFVLFSNFEICHLKYIYFSIPFWERYFICDNNNIRNECCTVLRCKPYVRIRIERSIKVKIVGIKISIFFGSPGSEKKKFIHFFCYSIEWIYKCQTVNNHMLLRSFYDLNWKERELNTNTKQKIYNNNMYTSAYTFFYLVYFFFFLFPDEKPQNITRIRMRVCAREL